jgi:hypothetical protein
MEIMTLTIQISKNVYIALEGKAKIRGESIEEYIAFLLQQYVKEIKKN